MDLPSYSELLKRPEWNAKRYEVFKRDNYECQTCKNQNFFLEERKEIRTHLIKGKILEVNKSITALKLFNPGDPRFDRDLFVVKFCIADASDIFKSEILSPIKINIDELKSFKDCEIYFFDFGAFFEETRTMQDRVIFRIINEDLPIDKRLFYIKKLQVHHNYYQKEKKPWEYHNGLITLCGYCHHEFHEKNEVPIRNSDGFVYDYIRAGTMYPT